MDDLYKKIRVRILRNVQYARFVGSNSSNENDINTSNIPESIREQAEVSFAISLLRQKFWFLCFWFVSI